MRNEFNGVSLGPAPQATRNSPTRGGSAGQSLTSPNGNGMYPAIRVQYANYGPQGQAQMQTNPAYVTQNGYGQQYTYDNAVSQPYPWNQEIKEHTH